VKLSPSSRQQAEVESWEVSLVLCLLCVDVGMLLPKYNGTREIFLNGLWGVLVTGHMMWDDL
jgi:hypothetical protein